MSHINSAVNLLPYDGIVHYYGRLMEARTAKAYKVKLLNDIEWSRDELMMFGKRIITKRKVAWYGSEPFDYTYSKVTKKALPWTPTLRLLKKIAEETSGESYNSCLLNLYHDGTEGMGWHRDNEKELLKDGAIASLSFGAERKFLLKHRDSKEQISVILEPGSMLLMKGSTQTHWVHRLPPTRKVSEPRVNLTFRTIVVP